MKRINIIYWICTGLVVAGIGIGSIFDTISSTESVQIVRNLGYPDYLVPFLGIAKILGLVAIVVPGYPKLKEWAYAGITFDLLGASYSQMALGKPLVNLIGITIPFVLLGASYVFYHKKLNMTKANSDHNDNLSYKLS
ncbi:MAG TPA: DoxX family protein [Mucilaginibacter sp.]|jgi:hypothetical protein